LRHWQIRAGWQGAGYFLAEKREQSFSATVACRLTLRFNPTRPFLSIIRPSIQTILFSTHLSCRVSPSTCTGNRCDAGTRGSAGAGRDRSAAIDWCACRFVLIGLAPLPRSSPQKRAGSPPPLFGGVPRPINML